MADRTYIDTYNYDPGAKRHSENKKQDGSGSKFVAVEGDDHEDPSTGSAMIYYPSRGN